MEQTAKLRTGHTTPEDSTYEQVELIPWPYDKFDEREGWVHIRRANGETVIVQEQDLSDRSPDGTI